MSDKQLNKACKETNIKPLYSNNIQKESKLLVSGNEALTRGLIEGGIGFAATYPGTPVSEVGDFLYEWSKLDDPRSKQFIFDYAINEIIALEEAIGASWSGVRSTAIFKHLGMNVASDALHPIMYSGIGGENGAGMLIICGGDPQSSSSTNAEDVRLYSKHTKIPILFPSSPEELRRFTKIGFELSEAIDLPIMIYTTPKLNFETGIINLDPLKPLKIKPQKDTRSKGEKNEHKIPRFERDMNRYVNAIHFAIHNQKKLLSKIKFLEDFEFSNMNLQKVDFKKNLQDKLVEIFGTLEQTINLKKKEKNHSKISIISGGLPFSLTMEVLSSLGLEEQIPILKINMLYPLNKQKILNFVKKFDPEKIIIIEELEPFIEESVKNILYDRGILIPIIGKSEFPQYGELTTDIIKEKLIKLIGIKPDESFHAFINQFNEFQIKIPIREPTFCPGCSHRNVFYALRKVADKLKKKKNIDVVFGGDIGCYTMGMSAPYSAMDWLISMGAGIGIANGVGRVFEHFHNNQQRIVALIGDSTFFHSGIQGLLNILKQNLNVTVIILNNYYVAMTGHQPTFTTINRGDQLDPNIGFQFKQLSLTKFVENLTETDVTQVHGYQIPMMKKIFEDIIGKDPLENMDEKKKGKYSNTNIIVVNSECALMTKKRASKNWEKPRGILRGPEYYVQISDYCPKCNECFIKLGCTAIKYLKDKDNEGSYVIDESSCLREYCNACIDVCENNCIKKTVINPNLIKNGIERKTEDL